MEKKFVTIKEAAEMLHVTKLTLRNWDKSGKLFALRHPINNYRVYHIEDIKKILDKIESGEHVVRDTRPKKPKTFRVSVIHLKD